MRARFLTSAVSLAVFSLCGGGATAAPASSTADAAPAAAADATQPLLFIVQADSAERARAGVQAVHAQIEQPLDIIHAVSAYLMPWQLDELRHTRGVRVYEDRAIGTRSGLLGGITSSLTSTTNKVTSAANNTVASSPVGTVTGQVASPVVGTVTSTSLASAVFSPLVNTVSQSTALTDGSGVAAPTALYQTDYPMLVGADTLQQSGVTGQGVTIAVLDTGLWQDFSQNYGGRILASVDVLNGGTGPVTSDPYGHGTHVTSIAAGGAQNLAGGYLAIAPKANLVIVQAFNGQGGGRYVDVIAGLNWIVAHQKQYNIRVLNLSFGAAPQSYYWDDPLAQAVMAAWRAGIVVVAAAGNEGPNPMTIDVPGNVPYIITVGALTDNNTPYNPTDDRLASFSSTGPTYEGFVKPEIVSPGGHIVASMNSSSYLANIDPNSMFPTEQMFTMSGTSMAAAVTTGVVALMIQSDPTLTPDNIKCRLLMSSRPAVTASGTLAYSVFQQGAGLINAVSAVNSSATGCANLGLDINADLAGTEHFGGPANQDANGNYYIMNLNGTAWGEAQSGDGLSWSQGYAWNQGYSWSQGYIWSQGYTWSRGYTWSKGYTWSQGYTWSKGYTWSRSVPWWNTSSSASSSQTSPAAIESWVPNQ
jgi:serine protease AprX